MQQVPGLSRLQNELRAVQQILASENALGPQLPVQHEFPSVQRLPTATHPDAATVMVSVLVALTMVVFVFVTEELGVTIIINFLYKRLSRKILNGN
jgi:hypothetical protein